MGCENVGGVGTTPYTIPYLGGSPTTHYIILWGVPIKWHLRFLWFKYEENTEEEKNGYVVFK
jgi:hypothetical protein